MHTLELRLSPMFITHDSRTQSSIECFPLSKHSVKSSRYAYHNKVNEKNIKFLNCQKQYPESLKGN